MASFPELDIISLVKSMDSGTLTLLGAACGVMLSMHFTMQLISQHLFYWQKPKEQKDIIFIIFMAPLYSLVSFIGLLDIEGTKIIFMLSEFAKDCYEALVVAKFMSLIYSYLNISLTENIVPDGIRGREIRNSFPLSLFLPYRIRLENHALKLLKLWVFQFIALRPVLSLLAFALRLLGFYPSWVKWTIILTLSISVSMLAYALAIFYRVFAKELAPLKAMSKFLCLNGIISLTFWQGFVLEALAASGTIQANHFWLKVEQPQKAIMHVFVLVEMVFVSVFQQYAYHFAPYSGGNNSNSGGAKND